MYGVFLNMLQFFCRFFLKKLLLIDKQYITKAKKITFLHGKIRYK